MHNAVADTSGVLGLSHFGGAVNHRVLGAQGCDECGRLDVNLQHFYRDMTLS